MFDRTYDQIEIGDAFISKGRTITEADLLFFSMMTQDWSDIHMDKEYVARTVFKERIAHAGLTMAVVSGLLTIPSGSPVEGLFGMNSIRFMAPVILGNTIHAELEVTGKEPRGDDRGVVRMRCEVKDQDGKVLVVAPLEAMVRRSTG